MCHLCGLPVNTTVNGYAVWDHLIDEHRWWFRLPDPEPATR